ncbi:hypothetical protein [Methanotorris formicicus]|uniref:Uncharacterized protein n=1 Tax=Methanotorris formicicus Mc-S-70 TaxID=647171 RepID=H1KYZ0_9EURY|nr:hypothetical protein [Methanotorris formicicus]EHP86570.1 hypothetical protein MetfoDRAFT_1010 [Methanotorris formicicus Mc-S-70]
MLFDSDIVIAVVVILVGIGFFASSMVGHTDAYKDALETGILYDKVNYQLKSLVDDGTIEVAILLLNNNRANLAEEIIKNRIKFKNYNLTIGNYSISNGNTNGDYVLASTVVLMNRTEGWYGIYEDGGTLKITDKYFMSEEEALNYLNLNKNNKGIAIYYFKSSVPIKVSLKVYGG